MRNLNDGLTCLLRDFGFRYDGATLVQCGVRGFTSDQQMGRFSSVQKAAEHLVPLVREAGFTGRFTRLTSIHKDA